jgi:signal transduction histidine kinase
VAHRAAAAPGLRELWLGVGLLLALVLALAGWLSVGLVAWQRRIRRIEAALAGHERAGHERADDGVLPHFPLTGERELDRIVNALNAAGARLAEARARSAALMAQVATGERLAALGRVAAGVAHEIRNPIAAMRLRAENALAGDPARRGAALEAILGQVARLDRLSGELLAMTQKRTPQPAPVAVDELLRLCAEEQAAGAVALAVRAPALRGLLDAGLLRRVLDALVDNALRHTPAGGTVTLSAEVDGAVLRVVVADTGPGVPEEIRAWLFEPFVSGRPEGTGLGLAIARELAGAMGGRLFLGDEGPGANFVLEVPWRAC